MPRKAVMPATSAATAGSARNTRMSPILPAVPLRLRCAGTTSVTRIQAKLAGELAAVERHLGAGDEATRIAGEETGQRRKIVRLA